MGRNLDRRNRCLDCLMKSHVCICSILLPLPGFENKTQMTILMHSRELVTTTNTARMALKLVPESKLFIRGRKDALLNPADILLKDHQPLYLYPTETAQVLTPELAQSFQKPVQLIVADGSWRQTRKFSKREAWLQNIPHVCLPDARKTLFFLRRRVKAEGTSTFEAIARALGILESQFVQTKMEFVFKTMVERTLQTRGKILEHYL